MAFPGAGGDGYPSFGSPGGPSYPAKRRLAEPVDDGYGRPLQQKRPKYVPHSPFAGPVAYRVVDEPPFLLQRRYPSPLSHVSSPEPAGPSAPAMERTASGHSIRSDPTERCGSTELLEDLDAAQRVRDHLATFLRRNPDSKHERILRSIINPRPQPRRGRNHHRRHHHQHHHHHHYHSHSHPRHIHTTHSPASEADDNDADSELDKEASQQETEEEESYPLDNAALESIFSAANEIFFNGRLSQRVAWDWSHASSARYDSRVIGTTALRRAAASTRGFETLVVLSSPILRDPRFSRRLLISTFLHELIHCYLFICCGFRARCSGGHTPGFREIAVVMEEWIGEGAGLYLSRVEADLELFRIGRGGGGGAEGSMDRGRDGTAGLGRPVNVYPCSGMAADQDEDAGFGAGAGAVAVPVAREVVYFGSGAQGSGFGIQDPLYVSRRVTSPSPGPAAFATQNVMQDYGDWRGSSGSNARWDQRRTAPAPYLYSGDEPAPTYVSPNNQFQRF